MLDKDFIHSYPKHRSCKARNELKVQEDLTFHWKKPPNGNWYMKKVAFLTADDIHRMKI